jgi:hypothetical protein
MIIFRSSGAVNMNGLGGISVETLACHVEIMCVLFIYTIIGGKVLQILSHEEGACILS